MRIADNYATLIEAKMRSLGKKEMITRGPFYHGERFKAFVRNNPQLGIKPEMIYDGSDDYIGYM